MDVLWLSITVFFTQIVFLYARTWNVRATAAGNMMAAIISGTVVGTTWLISIAIGADAVSNIIRNQQWHMLPVIISHITGGIVGTIIGMFKKKRI